MAGQLLHQEGAAAEFHNHSNRISTTAAVAAAAAVRADSACSSSRQPLSRNLRQSSQVQLIPWSAHSRCRCWLLEKETRRERDQSWNRALGRERERIEPCYSAESAQQDFAQQLQNFHLLGKKTKTHEKAVCLMLL